MKLEYTIHSVEPGLQESEVTLATGDRATARLETTVVELVADGRPTLTIAVPAAKYQDIGGPGDSVTVSVTKGGK